jgi:LysM repeat protein
MQQRRDVGNEVIVALAVIGMLALALVFGIVLTLSRTVAPDATTATASAAASTSVAVVSTEQATEASTSTEAATIAATATATSEVLATNEVAVNETAIPTENATAEIAAVTVEATSEATREAMSTATKTVTSTLTSTATSTATASNTATPSATNTNTPSRTPTATFTASATNTATRTPTPTATRTPTNTPTATPILDQGILPTNTFTPSPTGQATSTLLPTIPIPTNCVKRLDWARYTVQAGDTLFSIARQAKVTLSELQQANCIGNPNIISAGTSILIPPGVIILTNTPVVVQPSGTGNAGLCPNPNVRITSPLSGAGSSGVVQIFGTARADNFASYEVEFQPEGTTIWVRTAYGSTQVVDGRLGQFDPNPTQLPAGNYALRLRINVTQGTTPDPCTIKIKVVR